MPAIVEDVITQQEFALLPRRAQVALAARVARYVQPLLESTRDSAGLMEAAISAAENAESSVKVDATSTNWTNLHESFDLAIKCAIDASGKFALLTARAALMAAMDADEPAHDRLYTAYEAVRCAMYAWRLLNDGSFEVYANRIRHDFNRIMELAVEESWTDDTPVSTSIFGPLGHL